jgi:hypothetical protein
MRIISKTIGLSGLALLGMALGCSRYEPPPTPPMVPVSVDPAAMATHAELREAQQAADSARAQARAATDARVQAERAAAAIEARAVATGATLPATRTGPNVIGYGPSDAIDRAQGVGYGLPVAVGGGLVVDQSFGRQRSAATSTATGSAPLTGLGSPGFPTAATGTATSSAPLTGLGSPGFTTATDTSTRSTVNTSPLRRPDDPSRFTDGGSFDGGTRRDGGFADGGSRRPLSPTQQQALRSQQQQQQSQPSQFIQPQLAPSQSGAGTQAQTAPANGM